MGGGRGEKKKLCSCIYLLYISKYIFLNIFLNIFLLITRVKRRCADTELAVIFIININKYYIQSIPLNLTEA